MEVEREDLGGELCLNDNMKSQATTRSQERKDVWEAWAASRADPLRMCKEKVEGGADGSSTWCSLEDQEGGAPWM